MKLKAFCKVRKIIWQSEGILQNGQRYLSQTHTRQVTSVWLYKELQKFNTQKSQTIQFKHRAEDWIHGSQKKKSKLLKILKKHSASSAIKERQISTALRWSPSLQSEWLSSRTHRTADLVRMWERNYRLLKVGIETCTTVVEISIAAPQRIELSCVKLYHSGTYLKESNPIYHRNICTCLEIFHS